MAMTTQRLIMMVVAINLLIGIGVTLHESSNFDTTRISTEVNILENFEAEIESNSSTQAIKRVTNTLEDNTAGNTIGLGGTILKVFTRAINPLSFTPTDFEDQLSQTLAWLLILFRSFLILLVGFELYLVLKNKKTS